MLKYWYSRHPRNLPDILKILPKAYDPIHGRKSLTVASIIKFRNNEGEGGGHAFIFPRAHFLGTMEETRSRESKNVCVVSVVLFAISDTDFMKTAAGCKKEMSDVGDRDSRCLSTHSEKCAQYFKTAMACAAERPS